jgi:hypothetical protein
MPSEHDPYGVVPPDFCENWGRETIPAALEAAECAESSTDPEDRPRCPECGSTQVLRKVPDFDVEQKKDTRYKCKHSGCRIHFDKPVFKTTPSHDDCTELFDWLTNDELADGDERTSLSRRNGEPAESRPGACHRILETAD